VVKSPNLSDRLAAAFDFALELHRGQKRKRARADNRRPLVPYIAHLMAVCSLVLEHGGDEEEAIAALLHDGPEDQGGRETLEEIRRRFGERVAQIVEDCSDNLDNSHEPWLRRKEGFVTLLESGSPSDSTYLVSLADKVHNVRSVVSDYRILGEDLWEAFHGGREGKLWYYRTLLGIYRQQAPKSCQPLVEELEKAFVELEVLSSSQTG
jgi:(p)ppGpp synthase/HD superfamily hydrolase